MSATQMIQSDLDDRTQMYRLLIQAFQFPKGSQYEGFASGAWQEKLKCAARNLDFQLSNTNTNTNTNINADADNIALTPLCLSAEEYEVEFIALYEVGMGGAPCPLHSGHYQGQDNHRQVGDYDGGCSDASNRRGSRDRMKIMEEVLRFYRYFHYQPDRSADRFPDHLTLELGFMAHLSDQVHTTRLTRPTKGEKQLRSLTLAQQDFLTRNLVSWVPDLAALIEERSHSQFFKQSGFLLRDFIRHDYEYLQRQLLELEPANRGAHPHE